VQRSVTSGSSFSTSLTGSSDAISSMAPSTLLPLTLSIGASLLVSTKRNITHIKAMGQEEEEGIQQE
jgi:hypothetical protein